MNEVIDDLPQESSFTEETTQETEGGSDTFFEEAASSEAETTTNDSTGDHPFSTSSFTVDPPVKSSSNYSFHSSDLDEDLPPYM